MTPGDTSPTSLIEYQVSDFVDAFGATEDEVPGIAADAAAYNFHYRRFSQEERDKVILDILSKIEGFTKVGAHRSDIWESCWSDAKQTFERHDKSLESLDPVFMGANAIVRMHGDYALAASPDFETHWFRVMRKWLFNRHLKTSTKLFEFGCGSGYNLVAAGKMFPNIQLTGLDWSPSAVKLINEIGQAHGLNLHGRRFDFFAPDNDVSVDGDTTVMTVAALEQLGSDFVTFAEWLLKQHPKMVLSIEPIVEFYDPQSLVDDLALRFHNHRRYLSGYYSWVKAQADANKVEILHTLRPSFGSLYHEAYSVVAWRPI